MKTEMPTYQERNLPKVLFVQKKFFSQIESGEKTAELRVAFSFFTQIKPGFILEFRTGGVKESIRVRVGEVRRYDALDEVLARENVSKIAPGMSPEGITSESSRLFNSKDIEKYGLIVIDFEKV